MGQSKGPNLHSYKPSAIGVTIIKASQYGEMRGTTATKQTLLLQTWSGKVQATWLDRTDQTQADKFAMEPNYSCPNGPKNWTHLLFRVPRTSVEGGPQKFPFILSGKKERKSELTWGRVNRCGQGGPFIFFIMDMVAPGKQAVIEVALPIFGNYAENWRGKQLWKKVWIRIEESKERDP